MWFGTRTGRFGSAIRAWLIQHVLLRPPMVRRLPKHFAMLTIPGNADLFAATPPEVLS